MTSVPAADVEGAVLDHVQKLLAALELVARTWATATREAEDEITEREVTVLLADFTMVWNGLPRRAGADSSSCSSSGPTCRRIRSRCGSGLRGSRACSANCGRRARGKRHDAARRDVPGRGILVVRIPMRFRRRGGRKRILAPDGSELVPATKPQPDGTLVKAFVRAHRWQRVLESGE